MYPHLFTHYIFHGLCSSFGHPLQIDKATTGGSRPSMDPWYKHFGYIQKVVMNDFLNYCEYYKSIGHKKSQCFH
ncbi:hypothetical protein IEQ34_009254 [Dendrobium chrysotoxum]|uniref:Uncharacterized protein n=1 Tax=Dendrobium chrysotoxum TaxID=161865 RepID=A0AAV7H0U8_DENCH|nr:hypothetical protein IEQ34_009254 [Dendrobium chrysotoxum]